MRLGAVVLDSGDSKALADFYQKLLGWPKRRDGKDYISLASEAETVELIFQEDADYQRPVWPTDKARQQQMLHLDFYTDDLAKGVEHAVGCGAKLAQAQYSERWTVMLDPAGHPFCIVKVSPKTAQTE